MTDDRRTLDTDIETPEDRTERYLQMSVSDAAAILAADPQLTPTQRAAALAVVELEMREYYRNMIEADAPGAIH